MKNRIFIMDPTYTDWEDWLVAHGFPKFRAQQVFGWLSKGIIDTGRMTNLPDSLKSAIDEDFITDGFSLEKEYTSEKDGTRKFVFRLHDGHSIETVLMRYKYGLSVCISSQSGCKMGCAFCASAYTGFGRSLTSGEMLAQVAVVSDIVNERISRVVVMGIGEPFDNFENLTLFLRALNSPKGLNLGARHITVSTCGLVPQMIEFMCIDLQVNLSVSLHAASDELRAKLMPIAARYNLVDLLKACKDYVEKTGRRISFEYSLFDGVNDSRADARQLAALLRGIHCHINLIAANEFPDSPYRRSKDENVVAFMEELERLKMTVTLRREMGTDIMAACGQLRRGLREKSDK